MELPAVLRTAISEALEGLSTPELTAAAGMLSRRYRSELNDGQQHVSNPVLALAYIATRMPATYAAIRKSLDALVERLPGFTPANALDIGAGPATAMWAIADCWPGLEAVTLLEASTAMRAIGQRLSQESSVQNISWRSEDLRSDLSGLAPHDMVTLAYVLGELAEKDRMKLVGRLWELASGALIIVEPGTTTGWLRILEARARLLAEGAHILAPCPHAHGCPVVSPDWCHFSVRLARSRLHRLAKQGEAPWEDEKFIYLIASRRPAGPSPARILAPPESRSGCVRLKLCRPEGHVEHKLVTRRARDAFKHARRRDWGDLLDH